MIAVLPQWPDKREPSGEQVNLDYSAAMFPHLTPHLISSEYGPLPVRKRSDSHLTVSDERMDCLQQVVIKASDAVQVIVLTSVHVYQLRD
jgi:hypothetical protein